MAKLIQGGVTDWIAPPPKSFVEALTPIFGDGAFKEVTEVK